MFVVRNQSGAIAVIVALSIAALIGFAAFAIDVGYFYQVKRQLQSAADAAALAGAHELTSGTSDAGILAVAEEYAIKNDFPMDKGTAQALWMHKTPPTTEIGENYVKVTVEKTVNTFFGRIFRVFNTNIAAQAKAQVVYLTGGRGLVPWGLTIIRPTKVTAQIEGSTEELLSQTGDLTFSGTLQNVPTAARNSGYSLTVRVWNEQDFPEVVFPAAYITVQAATAPLQNIWFSKNYVSAGDPTTLFVESTGGPPTVRFNGRNYSNLTQVAANRYSLALSAPAITNAVQYFPVDVSVGQGAGGSSITKAAVLVVRRSTYPVKSIVLDKKGFVAGAGGSIDISVETHDFVFEELYDLKVVMGGETGNFGPLDFRYVWHPLSYTQNHGQNTSAADYYDNISGTYGGEIHIGDILSTQTGNLSAPSTAKALTERFGDHASHTWAWFIANGMPSDCRKIVLVPIIERIERFNGKSEVIVVQLGAFFIENIPDHGLNITGRFIEYVKPGIYTDEKPDGLYMTTVRLVKPDF